MLCIDSGLYALAAAVLPVPLNFYYIIINAFKKKIATDSLASNRQKAKTVS